MAVLLQKSILISTSHKRLMGLTTATKPLFFMVLDFHEATIKKV